jgi:CDGSH-type Zn-finger protein
MIMENESAKKNLAEVRILKNGPIMIKGKFTLRDSSGKTTKGEQELYLCRCGGSASKPWCDGTHKKIGVPD